MRKGWKLMLARFPYGGSERTELIDWVASANAWAQRVPEVSTFLNWHLNATPVTMSRNAAVMAAQQQGVDILFMVDSDMEPDMDRTKPFLPEAFDFVARRWDLAPTVIAAPYCQGAPNYTPTMGRWRAKRDGHEVKAELFTREEAILIHGIREAPFLGTGLMGIDMRIFTGFDVGGETVKLPPPWFEYEYSDEYRWQVATSEDMFFSRNVAMLFARHNLPVCFIHWDCWSYHWKSERVGKPVDLSPSGLRDMLIPWEEAKARINGNGQPQEVVHADQQ